MYRGISNCQDVPGWLDINGDNCEMYRLNPSLCKDAAKYKPINGMDAQTACCACAEIPSVPEAVGELNPFELETQEFNPCPENQVWSDYVNGITGKYIKVGNKAGPDGSVKGCWKQVHESGNEKVYTCNTDDFCKNYNAQTKEYLCPNATCNLGNCTCGPECKKDQITQVCIPQNTVNKNSLNTVVNSETNVGQCMLKDGECVKTVTITNRFGNSENYQVKCDPNHCGNNTSIAPSSMEHLKNDLSEVPVSAPISAPTSEPESGLEGGVIALIVIFSLLGVILLIFIVRMLRRDYEPKRSSKFG